MLRLNELSYKNGLSLKKSLKKDLLKSFQVRPSFCGSIFLGAALNWISMVRDDKYYTDVKRYQANQNHVFQP